MDWGNSLYTSAAKAGQQAAAFAADRAGWASAAATAAAMRTNGFSRRAAAGALAREYVRQEASALDVSARNAARSPRLPGADKLFRLSQVPPARNGPCAQKRAVGERRCDPRRHGGGTRAAG